MRSLGSRLSILEFDIIYALIRFVSGICYDMDPPSTENDFLAGIINDWVLYELGREWASKGFLKGGVDALLITDEYKAFRKNIYKRLDELAWEYGIDTENFKHKLFVEPMA